LRPLKSADDAGYSYRRPLTARDRSNNVRRDADRAAEERGHEVEGRATLNGVQLPQGAPPDRVPRAARYRVLFVPSS